METNEDDSVFSENAPAIKQEPGTTKAKTPSSTTAGGGGESTSKGGRRMSVSKERKQSNSTAAASTPATAASSSGGGGGGGGGGDVPAINITSPEGEPPYYHWCPHHQSVLLQLCCIVQTLAVKCPTAFITVKVLSGKGGASSRESTAKAITPLSQLPLRLVDLPMPKSLNSDLQKKVHIITNGQNMPTQLRSLSFLCVQFLVIILTSTNSIIVKFMLQTVVICCYLLTFQLVPALVSADQEISQRIKAGESRWSSTTVADLQNTSEGVDNDYMYRNS